MKSVDGKAFCIIDYSVKGDDRGRIGKALSPIVSQAVIEQSVHAKLFGNFAHREGVKVAVWMRSEQAEEFGPELWINYNRAHSVTEIDLAAIRALWKRLDRISVGLDAEAERKTKHWISQSIHILDSMVHLTPIGESLESYLDSILKGVQRAFDLESDEMVDVLLFRPGTRTLEVAKRFAPSLDHSVPREVDVPSLQGIASWVAVMGRALLVSNLQESAFRDLHIKVLGHTSSELTVPLLSGSELLGIINLESPRPNRFPPESVRPLWYAANQAAVAFRLVQQAEWTKRLLEIAHEATSSLPGPTTPSEAAVAHEKLLERLARLAREMLSGSECDIWHFNAREGHFKRTGATYDDSKEIPRPGGWSHHIHRQNTPVWLFNIISETKFSVLFWNKAKNLWETRVDASHPDTVNLNLVNMHIPCEIGMPLVSHGAFVGVAWVKFKTDRPPPNLEFMASAFGFAAEGGLIMDLYDRYHEAQLQVKMQQKLESFTQKLFKCGAFSFHGIECYVIRKPRGPLGGDFHHIYEHRPSSGNADAPPIQVNFFIGDAKGHGLEAGLDMLPIITTFKVVHKDSESTKHTLRRLLPITKEGDHQATALYFVVRPTERGLLLFASSSGHPPVMIYRNSGDSFEMLPKEWGNMGMLRGGAMNGLVDEPLAEELELLNDGDVLVAVTDGVLEAGDHDRRQGQHRLNSEVYKSMSRSAKEIAEAVEKSTPRDATGEFEDDVTIMVIKVRHPWPPVDPS